MAKELVGRLEDMMVDELVTAGHEPEDTREKVRAALRMDIVLSVRDAMRAVAGKTEAWPHE